MVTQVVVSASTVVVTEISHPYNGTQRVMLVMSQGLCLILVVLQLLSMPRRPKLKRANTRAEKVCIYNK